MADLLDPLDNAYTSRDLAYLKTQGFDYMLLVQGKSRQQPKVFMKSAGISVPSAIELLKSLTAPQTSTVSELTDVQKEMFPKTPGDIQDIFKDKRRIQALASELMQFWRTNLGLKMGKGKFKMWDQLEVNTGAMDYCLDLVELARSKIGDSFMITMSQIISWADMGGMHGLATGNAKRLLVPWSWIDFLKFFICWSYAAAGHNINTWRKTNVIINVQNKGKISKKSKYKEKASTKTKHVSTEKEKIAGRQAGLKRAMAHKRKSEEINDDVVMALAMSVSEEQEKEREREIKEAEIETAIEKSLAEKSETSAENKKKKKEMAISKTFPKVRQALIVLRGQQELSKEAQEEDTEEETFRDESVMYFRTPEKSPVFRKKRRALVSSPARSPSPVRLSSNSSEDSIPAEQDQFLSQASMDKTRSPSPLNLVNIDLSDEEIMMAEEGERGDEQEEEGEGGGCTLDTVDICQELEQEKVIKLLACFTLTYIHFRSLVSTTPRCPPGTSLSWWTSPTSWPGPGRQEEQVYGARHWSTRDPMKTTSPASTSLEWRRM